MVQKDTQKAQHVAESLGVLINFVLMYWFGSFCWWMVALTWLADFDKRKNSLVHGPSWMIAKRMQNQYAQNANKPRKGDISAPPLAGSRSFVFAKGGTPTGLFPCRAIVGLVLVSAFSILLLGHPTLSDLGLFQYTTNTSSVRCTLYCGTAPQNAAIPIYTFGMVWFLMVHFTSQFKYVKTSLSEPVEDCWHFVLQFVAGRVHLSEVCRLFAEEAWHWSGHVCTSQSPGRICLLRSFWPWICKAHGLCTDKSWVDDVWRRSSVRQAPVSG